MTYTPPIAGHLNTRALTSFVAAVLVWTAVAVAVLGSVATFVVAGAFQLAPNDDVPGHPDGGNDLRAAPRIRIGPDEATSGCVEQADAMEEPTPDSVRQSGEGSLATIRTDWDAFQAALRRTANANGMAPRDLVTLVLRSQS